ncbi:inositol monophosphatase [Pseudonocardia sp.]|uniref:inositol monophosphatase family protein n=1 Tax=Pseudonocardia sp. TaxID=60912 RepID=UPI0025E9755D|nr:inositol monophosphatase [Pseudonocardia sp.]
MPVAVAAARAGGAVLAATDRTRVDVTLKDARVDITTSADAASQAAVIAAIRRAFPEHGVIGEEGDVAGADPRHVWLVDGLDGTSNFRHGIPWYCVSVALRCREHGADEVVAGAVFDPVHDELWSAGRGRGATGNGVALEVDDTAALSRAVVVSQIQSSDPSAIGAFTTVFEALMNAAGGVRFVGAPALILSHIAAGHYTAYVERAMASWDISAGQLILEEAGGRLTDFAGKRVASAAVTDVVATNGPIHEALLAVLARL